VPINLKIGEIWLNSSSQKIPRSLLQQSVIFLESLEQGDHLLIISELIKIEKEKLEQDLEELIDEKYEEFAQETNSKLRPIKLDLAVEKNDIRMRKYFEMVQDFERK